MNVLSLFSGCGGMDLGFEGGFWCLRNSVNMDMHEDWVQDEDNFRVLLQRTQFDTVFADDILPFAKEAWVDFFDNRKQNARDIYRLDSIIDLVRRARAGEEIFPANIDVVTGGFPCQDFSVAGKRKGFHSEVSHTGRRLTINEPTEENRGKLYMWMREVVSLTQPRVFIAENVKGLTSLEGVREIIEHDFADAANEGYLVVPTRVLQAANYGVPQSRERIFFFGFRRNALREEALEALQQQEVPELFNPYPPATHGGQGAPFVTCADAFEGLQEPKDAVDLAQKKYSKASYLGAKGQGQNEVKLNWIAPTIRAEHHGNIEYRRLSLEHGGRHEEELQNGQIERRLTVRECARIQTFPDEYRFVINGKVSASEAYKIIGNAVPCLLAYNIAMNLQNKWELYFLDENV